MRLPAWMDRRIQVAAQDFVKKRHLTEINAKLNTDVWYVNAQPITRAKWEDICIKSLHLERWSE